MLGFAPLASAPVGDTGLGGGEISPPLLTNVSTFYPATIFVDLATISPALLTNTQTFFPPTIAPGGIVITPLTLSLGNTVFAPRIFHGSLWRFSSDDRPSVWTTDDDDGSSWTFTKDPAADPLTVN